MPRFLLAAGLATWAAAGVLPGTATAEQAQSGNLVLTLRGDVSPHRLPRRGSVPATASLYSRLTTTDGTPVPGVRRIEVQLGAAAVLDPHGSPACPLARLRNASGRDALARCREALVGRGQMPLEVRLPRQRALRRDPPVLLFNGRGSDGGRGLWALVSVVQPPVSFVLPFHFRGRAGSFATTLVAAVPRSIGRWARVRGFEIDLGRPPHRVDRSRSYLSASCPVPRPFTAGFLPVARTTYFFVGHRRLSEAIVRSCKVAR